MREGWPKNEKIRVIIVCILEVKKTSEFQFLVQTRREGEIFLVEVSPWLWSGVGTLERCEYLLFEYSLVEMWESSNYHQWRTVSSGGQTSPLQLNLLILATAVFPFVFCLYGERGPIIDSFHALKLWRHSERQVIFQEGGVRQHVVNLCAGVSNSGWSELPTFSPSTSPIILGQSLAMAPGLVMGLLGISIKEGEIQLVWTYIRDSLSSQNPRLVKVNLKGDKVSWG